MADFLSDDWLAALDAALRDDAAVRDASAGASLTVQQRVTDVGPDGATRSWYVTIADGAARVVAGDATAPDVTFTQDHATAVAIGSGELSAQAAFMLGKLRVGGDVTRLIAQRELFEGLDDVFAAVRAATTY